jgi:hypothetical protein
MGKRYDRVRRGRIGRNMQPANFFGVGISMYPLGVTGWWFVVGENEWTY